MRRGNTWAIIALSACVVGVVANQNEPPARRKITLKKIGHEFRDLAADFGLLNIKFFEKETLLTLTAFAPLYGMARAADEKIHHGLYNEGGHFNTFYLGSCSKLFVEDVGVAVPLLALVAYAWSSRDYRMRFTGRSLLNGLIAVGLVKDVIKSLWHNDVCRRPFSGCFAKKPHYGGFPSGHAATVVYMTMLFGLTQGAKWAIPLGMYSGVVLSMLLMANYHYVSQLVAGAALGAAFAVAANKVVNMRLDERLEMGIGPTPQGGIGFNVGYSF